MISSSVVLCLIFKLVVIIAEPYKITQLPGNSNYQLINSAYQYPNSKSIQNVVTTKYPWTSGYYSAQSYSTGTPYSTRQSYPTRQFYSTGRSYSTGQTHSTEKSYTTTKLMCQTFGACDTPIPKPRSTPTPSKFKTEYEWKQLDFDYETRFDREKDIKKGIFIPGKPAPVDVDVHYNLQGKRIFVAIPRFLPGVPATLGTVTTSKSTGQPLIKPYPSWKWHRYPGNCGKNRITSVYRIKIDKCGRLWVLDTGRLSTERICPMQILAFDLRTDELLHRSEIPKSVLHENSILVTPIIEIINDNCDDTFVYIADTVGFAIIIHDVKRGAFWKASDKTMYPYPNHSSFDILGDNFDLVDGVLGMDIGPKIPGEGRKLYYHSLSSVTENWVFTDFLRNKSIFGEYPWVHPSIFNVYTGVRDGQSAAQAIDRNGISFFGKLSKMTINCWDTSTEYGSENIDVVEHNEVTLQFPSGIKVVDNPISAQEELWVITSRLQKVIAGTLQHNEFNYRILVATVQDAVSGTMCKRSNATRKQAKYPL